MTISPEACVILGAWFVAEVLKLIGMRRAGAQLDQHRYSRPLA